MSNEKLSGDVAAPSTIQKLQKELKEGGPVLDTLTHQLTETLFDAMSSQNVMTDLDSLYDIISKSVKTTIGVWVGGSTEPIVSHDALKQAEEQRAENPDLDTRKSWNEPNDPLFFPGVDQRQQELKDKLKEEEARNPLNKSTAKKTTKE